jgi:ADP-heptose:LPS heptosyltransferase
MPKNKRLEHIVILRFSAIGDVAMVAAAVHEFAVEHPAIHFTVASQPFLEPLFDGMENGAFFPADIYKSYHGLYGLWKLFVALRKLNPDVVADLHDVLRTKVLRFLFRLNGTPVTKINKGRKEKRELTRRRNKKLRPLKSMLQRYKETLCKAVGSEEKISSTRSREIAQDTKRHTVEPKIKKIGIAPFAKHKGKIYPVERMEKIIAYFAACDNIQIYLFGGGKKEIKLLSEWEQKYPGVVSLAGKMPLSEELIELSCMDVVLSMDSANMHLASFMCVPVVSVWGATHPYTGFTGWHQFPENCIQLDMSCRPCSVFGRKPCYKGNYACMNIPEDVIIEKIQENLQEKN